MTCHCQYMPLRTYRSYKMLAEPCSMHDDIAQMLDSVVNLTVDKPQ
jgi:hypothetical protein